MLDEVALTPKFSVRSLVVLVDQGLLIDSQVSYQHRLLLQLRPFLGYSYNLL